MFGDPEYTPPTKSAPANGANEFGDVPVQDKPGIMEDLGKSAAAAAAKALPVAANFVGDTANAATQGITRLAGAAKEGMADLGIGNHLTVEQAQQLTNPKLPFYGSQEQTNAVAPAIQQAIGANINYQPQHEPGKLVSGAIGALPYAINPEVSVPRALAMGVGGELGKEGGAAIGGEGSKAEQLGGLTGGFAGGFSPEIAQGFKAASQFEAPNTVQPTGGLWDVAKSLMNNESGVTTNAALGGIPEGVAIRAKGAFGTMSPENISATSDKNWQAATDSFKSSRASGAALTPQAGQAILQNVENSIKQAGILNPTRHADTMAALEDLRKDVNDGTLTLEKLDQHRQAFGDAVKDNTTKMEGTNSDGYRALQGKNAIVDSIGKLGQNDFTQGSPQAAQDLLTGINQYAKAARFDRLAEVINKAEGDSTALKRGLTSYVQKLEKNPAGHTPEEIAVLKDAASRSPGEAIERALGTFGFDFGKAKNVALPAITSGTSMVVPGGGGLAAAGTVARQTGKYAARGKAQNALDVINSRDTTPSAPMQSAAPNPPKPLALPAPKTTIVGNAQGQNIAITPAGREILGTSAGTAAEQRPNAAIEAQNALRQKTDEGYQKYESAQSSQRDADMQKFMRDNQVPIQKLIEDTATKYRDAGIQPGQLGQALFNILHDQAGSVAMPDIARILDGLASAKIPGYAATIIGNSSRQAQDKLNPQPKTIASPNEPMNYSTVEKQPDKPFNSAMSDKLTQAFGRAESNNNPNAKNPNSSASGLMQFTNRTWADMVNKYGAQTGIKLGDKANPQAQQVMARLYAQDNIKELQKLTGRMPTQGELYAAHVLGPHGAAKLLNANPNQEAIMLFPRQVFDGNRQIFFTGKRPNTVGEVKQILAKKVA